MLIIDKTFQKEHFILGGLTDKTHAVHLFLAHPENEIK
jgi:hypothetical protein